jgi:dynein heavy chain
MLLNYKREDINPKHIKKLEDVCFSQEDFNEKKAYAVSQPIGYLFNWVKAMYDFFKVFTETQPMRDKL